MASGLGPGAFSAEGCSAAFIGVVSDLFKNPAVQMLLGAILSALVSVLLDWRKRPRLEVSIGPRIHSTTKDAERRTIEEFKSVQVVVKNTKRWPAWWPRQTVIRATGLISFHDPQTGRDLFNRRMRGRWASLPQPEIVVLVHGKKELYPDPALSSSVPEIDIPWGCEEPLDVATRFEADTVAYGWSNENYYEQGENYRASRWCIPWECCLVRIVIGGSGEQCTAVYRLSNPSSWDPVLHPATKAEEALLV